MEDAVEQLISRNQDLLLRHASASVSASDRERVDRAAEPVLRDMRAGLRNGIARCGAQDDRLLRAVRRLAGAAGDEIQG